MEGVRRALLPRRRVVVPLQRAGVHRGAFAVSCGIVTGMGVDVSVDFGLRVHREGVLCDLQGGKDHVVARRESGLSEGVVRPSRDAVAAVRA